MGARRPEALSGNAGLRAACGCSLLQRMDSVSEGSRMWQRAAGSSGVGSKDGGVGEVPCPKSQGRRSWPVPSRGHSRGRGTDLVSSLQLQPCLTSGASGFQFLHSLPHAAWPHAHHVITSHISAQGISLSPPPTPAVLSRSVLAPPPAMHNLLWGDRVSTLVPHSPRGGPVQII